MICQSEQKDIPFTFCADEKIFVDFTKERSHTSENLPATKYLDLHIMLFWWQEKNKDLTAKQQVDELYSYICNRLEETMTYEKLQDRELQLDTKGLIPTKV